MKQRTGAEKKTGQTELADTSLQAGREAFERHAWREAFDLLTSAQGSEGFSAEDLDHLGDAAWLTGRIDECIGTRERAYAAYLEAGNRRRAAFMALRLAEDYWRKLAQSVAAGWLGQAVRLLEGEPESPEHGYLAYVQSLITFLAGDIDAMLEHSKRAFDIGERLGDRDVQALGLSVQGHALVAKREVAEGLALLDEAMAAAVAGELDIIDTGSIYCSLISTCENLADYRRAAEWTEVANRWCERQSVGNFPGQCRTHRARIMRLRGAWTEAEQDARRACDELEHFAPASAALAFYEVGEIRLRVGDLTAAEDAFRQANELGRNPQPGLSLLRLAQGDANAANTMVSRALADESLDPLARARLLPARVEAAVAADDVESARSATEELETTAKAYGTAAFKAYAACSRGALQLAEGDAAAACESLRRGWRLWQEVDAPYEAARARVLLAAASRADGDGPAAVLELQEALATFERLGATLDARHAADLLATYSGTSDRKRATPARRATKTFMFTDIVKSTDLTEAMGDEAWEDVLRWHDETLRSCLAKHAGEEVKHGGDGFFVAFDAPAGAIECAVAIQRTLADHRREQGFAPQVRIGLHTAAAIRRGRDYTGTGVNQAARIAALADGGEILASLDTLTAEPIQFPQSEPRSVSLKGISNPVEVAAIEWR